MAAKNKRKNTTTKNTNKNPSNQKLSFGFDLTILTEYLAIRAKEEGVEFDLTQSYLDKVFIEGARNIFGVELNNIGFPLWDNQERSKGALNNFICWFFMAYG